MAPVIHVLPDILARQQSAVATVSRDQIVITLTRKLGSWLRLH